jgi:hypothetical protein
MNQMTLILCVTYGLADRQAELLPYFFRGIFSDSFTLGMGIIIN